MTRDNIALLARLEMLDVVGVNQQLLPNGHHPEIVIGNVHIHWDPTFKDVKLVQAIMLAEEVEKFLGLGNSNGKANNQGNKGLVLCGDFNSLPESGVLQFLTGGGIGPRHADFMQHTYEPYSTEGAKHRLQLSNAFDGLMEGGLLPVTNFTPGFSGVIDHILYRPGSLALTGVLGGIPAGYLKQLVGFPTQHQPSDHLSLMAEFRVEGVSPTPPGFLHMPSQQQQQVNVNKRPLTGSQPVANGPVRFGAPIVQIPTAGNQTTTRISPQQSLQNQKNPNKNNI